MKLIAAVEQGGGIGFQGDIPWRVPDDLIFFKRVTLGDTLIMGRATWESIGMPLPKRHIIVVTSQKEEARPGVEFHDYQTALTRAADIEAHGTNVWLCGGSKLYEAMIHHCDTAIMTYIHGSFKCDTFFPLALLEQKFLKVNEEFLGHRSVATWVRKEKAA